MYLTEIFHALTLYVRYMVTDGPNDWLRHLPEAMRPGWLWIGLIHA